MKSVRMGGQDALAGLNATRATTLDVLASTNGGEVHGTVVEREKAEKEKSVDDDHPVPNAMVVAVPEEKYRKLPSHFGVESTDQHGGFTLRGLAPGDYTIFAWQDIEQGTWSDPAFLKSQEAYGTYVKVEEGTHQTVELKLSPVSEEWR